MAPGQSALIELLKELELTDTTERIRLLTQRAFQELINAEAETVIGAAPYERSEGRTTQRNGTRSRTLSTTAGDLDLRIPKLREGSFSRRCSSDDAESIKHCLLSSWKPMCTAYQPGRLMIS